MGGRAFLGLIGGMVLLAGYTVGWYGFVMLQGITGPGVQGGIGFLDLLVPSHNKDGSVDQKLRGGPSAGVSGAITGAAAGAAGGSGQIPPIPVGGKGAAPISRAPGGGLPGPGTVAGRQ